jgi:thioredoxin-related protein
MFYLRQKSFLLIKNIGKMKNLIIVLVMFATVTAFAADKVNTLTIGDKAALAETEMQAVSGEMVSIESVKKANGVLVLFSSNTCPFVKSWEDRYFEAKKWADNNEVGMLVLNSNAANRDGVDSFEAMKTRAKEQGYNFHYAVDVESKIANAFGGQTTPHAFLFNSNMELVYKGVIDDNYKNADEVSKTYLKDAIISVGNGEKVAVAETKPVGCSIKRHLN